MLALPDLFRIERFRFNARVARELTRRQKIDGDNALASVLSDLKRPDLRSRYRETLQAVADRLSNKSQNPARTLISLIPFQSRSKSRKSMTSG